MKVGKLLFALFFAIWVILCLSSCSFDRNLYVREVVVNITAIDTVWRYTDQGGLMPYAVIKVVDADGIEYELNPPKPFPVYDKVGDHKIVYQQW